MQYFLINSFLAFLAVGVTRDEQFLLKDWIKERGVEPRGFELVYRATENGFSGAKFQAYCKKVENLLVIVQIGKNVFGGFTSEAFDYTPFSDSPANDPHAFLFTLKNSIVGPMRFDPDSDINAGPNSNPNNDFYDKAFNKPTGPAYGHGYISELVIYGNSNKYGGECNLNWSPEYEGPYAKSIKDEGLSCAVFGSMGKSNKLGKVKEILAFRVRV